MSLSATPAGSFSFRSRASWPEESYDDWVRRGVLDELEAAGAGMDFGAEFVLEEIGWHVVDSSGKGYYKAARLATRQILNEAEAMPVDGRDA